MKRLLAMLLALLAFGLIAAHLHLPNAAQSWRVSPHAAARKQEKMPLSMPEGEVDINTASEAELDTLPGIGPALAQRIISQREENGLFHYPEDLLSVYGIGEKTLDKLYDLICLP